MFYGAARLAVTQRRAELESRGGLVEGKRKEERETVETRS